MSHTYKIDDSIVFKSVDETLANVDLKYLMQAKLEMLKEGKDTSILDKAIEERKRRDEMTLKYKKQKEHQEKKLSKQRRRALLFGLISGLSPKQNVQNLDNSLMPWEQDAIKDGYESFNFEEEELEEDDFYYDDDK